jgi:hypothetical protein
MYRLDLLSFTLLSVWLFFTLCTAQSGIGATDGGETSGNTTGNGTTTGNDFTCTPTDATVTEEVCSELTLVMYPEGLLPDVAEYFEQLKVDICDKCESKSGKKFLCAMIYRIYNEYCPLNETGPKLPCRSGCEGVNIDCTKNPNYNKTVFDPSLCSSLPFDDEDCISFTSGDECTAPPFLLRSTCFFFFFGISACSVCKMERANSSYFAKLFCGPVDFFFSFLRNIRECWSSKLGLDFHRRGRWPCADYGRNCSHVLLYEAGDLPRGH